MAKTRHRQGLARYRPRTIATVAREQQRKADRRPRPKARRAVPRLPLRQPYYTADELQQHEYLAAIGDTVAGTRTPEYREERRVWIATQRRAAKRYGARRAKSRPRVVKHTKKKPVGRIKVRAHTRRRPR